MAVDYFRWIAEILILSVAFYFIWRWLRGTRGAKVLIGLAFVILGLKAISTLFDLDVIEELLHPFFAFYFIALVVLFQPELRKILAELGSRHPLRQSQEQIETIEAVIGAIEYLQREHFGALIAFEQEVSYDQAHEAGTAIDALVSSDLLATLFYPKTPLHDGGVIIRQNRIIVAGAIFPLTQAERLQRSLGLRHRAALGLSEETDALVVVLSEERSTISLAHQGKMLHGLSADELRAELIERIHGPTQDSSHEKMEK